MSALREFCKQIGWHQDKCKAEQEKIPQMAFNAEDIVVLVTHSVAVLFATTITTV